jgi:hypothetical protein
LVDEFWEVKEEYQWLRDYTRAFHHESKNLANFEKSLEEVGRVVKADEVGRIAVGNRCEECNEFWGDVNYAEKCKKCGSKRLIRSLFADVKKYRNELVKVPPPSPEKLAEADKYLKPNPVGIFARGRSTYGRNLQPEFYVELIKLLESMGYNPIWLGEKQSSQSCPVDHIVDMTQKPEARDLELTVAIVSKLKFTVQFWTASTRLSLLAGTPFLLFESPMQIWGSGQEGYRLGLLRNCAPRKLVICHYINVLNNHPAALQLIKRCVNEMMDGNFNDVIGMVDEKFYVEHMKRTNSKRIGE